MHNILYISAHAPTLKYPQAGQKIALGYLEEYAETSTHVDVCVIANRDELEAAQDLDSKFQESLYSFPTNKLSKAHSCFKNMSLPMMFASRWRNDTKEKIIALSTNKTYDLVHFEYSHAAVYLKYLKTLASFKDTKIVISIHDIISQSFLRKSQNNPLIGVEVSRLFHKEKEVYTHADELWVLSGKDRDILTSLFSIPSTKIVVKPPRLSDFIYKVSRNSQKIEKKSLLFWGAMDRSENQQAIFTFIEQCFNKLLTIDPEYKLYIVGSKPSSKIRSLSSKNIIITGFVEDPTYYFENAEVGIIPLTKGAGIKLKTLEMIEAGLPILSTTVGAEGVDYNDCNFVVSDNFDDWPNLLFSLGRSRSLVI